MEKYIAALRKTGAILDAKFAESVNIKHAASKGSVREFILSEIITPFIPNIFGFSAGECFSSDDEISKQLDLIIYDKLYSIKIPYSENFIQFPCESVYGNIEVKSYLNKPEFGKSIENIASLKKLKREQTTQLNLTPFYKLVLGDGLKFSNEKCANEYLGIVFAYNSPRVKTVLEYFENISIPKELLPDFIVLYQRKTIIFRTKGDSILSVDQDYDGFGALPTGDDTLPLFIDILICRLASIRLKIPQIDELTVEMYKKIISEKATENSLRLEFKKNALMDFLLRNQNM